MLTTVNTGNLIKSGKIDFRTKQPKLKPDCSVDNIKNMRLLDKADMQISSMEFIFYFYFYLYIYPPDSQESDGGANT